MSAPAREQPAGVSLRPYEQIYEHAEQELELAGRGDLQGLTAMGARWDELIAELPPCPPGAAGPLLERAKLLHERTHVELIRLRDGLLADLATATRARRTADGYAGRLAQTPRIDRSA